MGRSILFSVVLMLGAGISTYVIKSQVIGLESEIVSMRKQITQYEEGLHVLQAEWSYLNRPERLQALAEAKLGLIVSNHHQLVSYEPEFEEEEEMMPPPVHLVSTR